LHVADGNPRYVVHTRRTYRPKKCNKSLEMHCPEYFSANTSIKVRREVKARIYWAGLPLRGNDNTQDIQNANKAD